MMDREDIKRRLAELREKNVAKVEWTRQRALNEINYVLDMNKKDMERIAEAYQQDLDRKDYELQQWVQLLSMDNVDIQKVQLHINQLLDEMSDIRKKRRVNAVNTAGILNAARTLNRMYGYDITKVEINPQDEEREEMEKLSAEELKELININKKEDN